MARSIESTHLFQAHERVYLKLEFLSPGRSHKTRAAAGILNYAESTGQLVRHTQQTIIEKSGGNLGIPLTIEGLRRGYGVELVVGLSYSEKKRALLRRLGAELVGLEELHAGYSPAQVIQQRLEHRDFIEKSYVFLDQFTHPGNFQGHLLSLAPELAEQLQQQFSVTKDQTIHLVLGAGTGASAAALQHYFRSAGYEVLLHLVEPEGCDLRHGLFSDHGVEGVAVGVRPPFLDLTSVTDFVPISDAEAHRGCDVLLRNYGLFVGRSSGANFAAISKVLQSFSPCSKDIIVSLLYDRGEDYENI